MYTHRFLVLDVFTEQAFAGNQLAVFTNAVGLTDEKMAALAREIGFSETAFVLPAQRGGDFRLRIFTPARELPFAGHPTLGAAFATAGPLQSTLVRIETESGIVPVTLEREGAKIVFGRMVQPIPKVAPWPDPEELLAALGLASSELPIEVYDTGIRHVFVCVPDFAAVAALRPDAELLRAAVGEVGANVFAFDGVSAKTRMFWFDNVLGEDAATGSAAGPLAVHLARHERIDWGTEIAISQGAEIGRPSTLYAKADGSAGEISSVEVGGSAVVVARGEFAV